MCIEKCIIFELFIQNLSHELITIIIIILKHLETQTLKQYSNHMIANPLKTNFSKK